MAHKPVTNFTLVRLARQAGVSVEAFKRAAIEALIMEEQLKAPGTSTADKQRARERLGLPLRGPKKKPGRIKDIVNSVEAFRSTGLSRENAEKKTAEAWCLGEHRVQNIYKLFKVPSRPHWLDGVYLAVGRKPPRDRDVREMYRQLKLTEQQVFEAIARHRAR
jgi:hypothetical protein